MLFWFLFGVDCLAATTALYFFLWGLDDGTVSTFNIGIWALLLGGIGAVLGGGWWLRARGYRLAAIGALLVLAVPVIGATGFIGMLMILQPRWN